MCPLLESLWPIIVGIRDIFSISPKVGNPVASILKSNVQGILALIVLNPFSNFLGSLDPVKYSDRLDLHSLNPASSVSLQVHLETLKLNPSHSLNFRGRLAPPR